MGSQKKKGFLGWSTSVFPQELVEAFGLPFAIRRIKLQVLLQKEALGLCEEAEGEGYSIDLCAYARTNFGFLEKADLKI